MDRGSLYRLRNHKIVRVRGPFEWQNLREHVPECRKIEEISAGELKGQRGNGGEL